MSCGSLVTVAVWCRLSGQPAVKSKNVCLQLVDGHTELTDCGVVQLFTTPHPQRAAPSPYWGVAPPRIHHRDRISQYHFLSVRAVDRKLSREKISKWLLVISNNA